MREGDAGSREGFKENSRISMINLPADLPAKFPQLVDRKCSGQHLTSASDQIVQQTSDPSQITAVRLDIYDDANAMRH